MPKLKKIILFNIIFVFSLLEIKAQKFTGLPEVYNYASENHTYTTEQIWQIIIGRDGLIYTLSNNYLLEFDGYNWRVLKKNDINTFFLSAVVDSNYNFYFGLSNGIATGKIRHGKFYFERIDLAGLKVNNVFKTFKIDDYIYFSCNNKDVLYLHNNKYQMVARPSNFEFNRIIKLDTTLYVISNKGFGKIAKGKFKLITYKRKDIFLQKIRLILNYSDDTLLIGTQKSNFYLYSIKDDKFIPFKIKGYSRQSETFFGTAINDSTYLTTSLNNGIYIFNKKGILLTNINQATGLKSDAAYSATIDAQKRIWIGTGFGMSALDFNTPFHYIDDRFGISNTITHISLFENYLLISTIKQSLFLDLLNNKIVKKFDLQYAYNNIVLKIKGKKYLITGGYYKILGFDTKLNKILEQRTDVIFDLQVNPIDSSQFYISEPDGVWLWQAKIINNKLQIKKLKKIYSQITMDIEADKKGNLWLISNNNEIFLFRNNKLQKFPNLKTTNIIIKDSLIFLQEEKYNYYGTINFENPLTTKFQKLQTDSLPLLDILSVKTKFYLFYTTQIIITDKNFKKLQKIKHHPTNQKLLFKAIKYKNNLFFPINNKVNILELNKHNEIKKKIKLRSITSDKKYYFYSNFDTIFQNIGNNIFTAHRKLKSKQKIGFEFYICPIPLTPQKLYFKKASDSTAYPIKDNNLIFRELKWGQHTYSIFTNEKNSPKLTLNFFIKIPFYASAWSYAFYTISLFIIFLLIFNEIRRQFSKRKKILEKLVEEKTKQINEQKEEIASQTKLLEKQKTKLERDTLRLETALSELKELSTVASKTDNSVLIIEKNLRFEWWNRRFSDLFQHKIKKYKNLPFKEASKKIRPDVYKELTGYTKDKGIISYTQNEKVTNDENIWYQTTIYPIFNDNGELLKFVVIDKDITDEKLADLTIQKLHRKIEKLKDENIRLRTELSLADENKEKITKIYSIELNYAKILKQFFFGNKILSNSFSIEIPKKDLSGDFVWTEEYGNIKYIIVGDTSGIRIRSLVNSIIVINILKDKLIENKNIPINQLISYLNNSLFSIREIFETIKEKDNFVLSIVKINTATKSIEYTGTKIPLIFYNGSTLTKFITNHGFLGIQKDKKYVTHSIKFTDGNTIYLYTDGFPNLMDTFGLKKYTAKRIYDILDTIKNKPLAEQEKIIRQEIDNWKGSSELIDDLLIFGLKL